MADLTKQLLLKMLPELEEKLDKAFSAHLKLTGDPITKAEYIRRFLDKDSSFELIEADFRKKESEHMIIKNPRMFQSRVGNNLFIHFLRGFAFCNKMQTNMHLYLLNSKYADNPIAQKRNSINLFFRIISDINEFEETLNSILQLIYNSKLDKTKKSNYFQKLKNVKREIGKNKHYAKIRNQIAAHDGDIYQFQIGIDKCDTDGYFIFAECLSSYNSNSVKGNDIIYNAQDLILLSLNINNEDWVELIKHSLKVGSESINDFQLLFHTAYCEALADNLIYRQDI